MVLVGRHNVVVGWRIPKTLSGLVCALVRHAAVTMMLARAWKPGALDFWGNGSNSELLKKSNLGTSFFLRRSTRQLYRVLTRSGSHLIVFTQVELNRPGPRGDVSVGAEHPPRRAMARVPPAQR